ncbi:alpha/beta fold hydrolase [Ideonella sp.]|uniref:alpha/beta fold hydrolase n=1 Tax=Ideonella sp. TaxID=1929293 RepID=UPI003BB55210
MSPIRPPTWLLLRGLTRGAAHWSGFAERLQQALPGARVLTPELPGNGRRHTERSPATIGQLTEALRADLAAAGEAGPFQVIAVSMGAMVALDWASRHPQDLSGALLINTSVRPLSPFYRRLQPARYGPLLRCLLAGASAEDWERLILNSTSAVAAHDPGRAPGLIQAWAEERRRHPVGAANALRQLLASSRYRLPPRPPAVPMRVLSGAQDRLVHPACSHALARAWGLPLAVHPQAGHDLTLDAPDWVIAEALASASPITTAQG